jgi:hypothetical protein
LVLALLLVMAMAALANQHKKRVSR